MAILQKVVVIGMACVEAVLHFVFYDSSVIRPEEEFVVEAINYKLEIDSSESVYPSSNRDVSQCFCS